MTNSSDAIDKASQLLTTVKGRNMTLEELAPLAIELAALILKEAMRHQTESEKQQQSQIANMMNDPQGKTFTSAVTDQCFRSHRPYRTADQLNFLIKKYGIPKFLPPSKRFGLRLFKWFGGWLPKIFVPIVKQFLRQEASGVILPGEPEALAKHLARRRKERVRINLNHLGEAILGEAESEKRLQMYIEDLKTPYIEYISIKISTIYSQISPLAKEETLEILAQRLKQLYRTAQENPYRLPDGTTRAKFVNLDMEEYKDLDMTLDLFCKVLMEPEFLTYSAGIVLQSYLPEAYNVQKKLTEWAIQRCQKGGAPIKIRIVKGANLAMEVVESSLKGWAQAPFKTKVEVDANYKKMLMYGCQPEHAKAVYIGVASHNVFDSSLALLLRAQYNLEAFVSFEMLEGMADQIRRAIQTLSGEILLYCPAATKDEFQNAIAYLVRRLDENTGPENFLRHLFNLKPGTKEWESQVQFFNRACQAVDHISNEPQRTQNRHLTPVQPNAFSSFHNEPDTDWSLLHNVEWAHEIISKWKNLEVAPIPLSIDGNSVVSKEPKGIGYSPSAPDKQLYRYELADSSQANHAIDTAEKAFTSSQNSSAAERSQLLAAAAQQLREARGDLIGAMVLDGGKTIYEADAEVSEAIDFAEYYRRNIEEVSYLEDLKWKPKGPVLVVSPWNFPCSIPAGGILAALAAGNSVIFKPAPEVVLVGWILVQALWKSGIDQKLLQFITCEDDPVGSQLIRDPRIAVVLLTGATATARYFQKLRPGIDLIAETGGKNSIIVTSLSDRDLAIKELIASAFSNAGQKCSACSLGILEAEVYDDPHFRRQLRDAAASLPAGNAWDFKTKVNPLIENAREPLLRGLTELDSGEEWLLKPIQNPDNPNIWSPGIKLGVKEGSFTHQTELFGPVLGLMRADNLAEAIKLANGTPYGLTSGLQSLDEREQTVWIEKIEAGNCYINRGITGAIVQRQPFGGCKASSFGRGAKAGGPNYLMQLMHAEDVALPKEKGKVNEAVAGLSKAIAESDLLSKEGQLWQASVGNYAFYWSHYFSKKHDPSRLIGQDNILCYRPHQKMILRLNPKDSLVDILRVCAAAMTVACPLYISTSNQTLKSIKVLPFLKDLTQVHILEETDEEFRSRLAKGEIERLRLLSSATDSIKKAAAEGGCRLQYDKVAANGRIELLHYLREISLSIDYHRYGYLGSREMASQPSG